VARTNRVVVRSVAGLNAVVSCNSSSAYKKEWQLEFRRYRQLTRRKRAEFWRTSIDENRSSPQRLWRSINKLMGREELAASPDITASDFQHFFVDKVAAVRASTDSANDPAFINRRKSPSSMCSS